MILRIAGYASQPLTYEVMIDMDIIILLRLSRSLITTDFVTGCFFVPVVN